VVAKVRKRLSVSKQQHRKFDVERCNLKKLCEVQVREQYHSKILNKFAALENFINSEGINRGGEDIKENIKFQLKAV
jgi:hypothetical protein